MRVILKRRLPNSSDAEINEIVTNLPLYRAVKYSKSSKPGTLARYNPQEAVHPKVHRNEESLFVVCAHNTFDFGSLKVYEFNLLLGKKLLEVLKFYL